jgi:cardiolipin synthase
MNGSGLEWDKEILFTAGDEYFAGLLNAISTARHSIELESYIFERGLVADRLISALIACAKRGVRVRLIVDGLGSPGFVNDYWPSLKKAGARVRFFRVFPWIIKRLPGDPESITQRMLLRLRQMNRGNHRKFCLIDHHELWVGSFNISDVHLREVYGDEAWKDAGVCVRGHDLKYARRAFQRAWRGWAALNWPARSPKLLLLNDSFLHKRRARVQQIQIIKKATERVWLATPYFVPVGHVFRLLIRRAKEGLDVRLIIPRKNDVWIMKWMSAPLLKTLCRKGVKVFVYEPRFSHQKLFIADGWISIGSTNLNHRSFLHDLEMDVVITHAANKERILEGFRQDQALSQPFDSTSWARIPFWKRLISSVFMLLKYWA